ncbi:MAG: CocE/NonD family hydrolase [Deltaproteobacteria bacterium]|nr:CocE/NonD family hydrolase [Deltaproteobacteria bacterium]
MTMTTARRHAGWTALLAWVGCTSAGGDDLADVSSARDGPPAADAGPSEAGPADAAAGDAGPADAAAGDAGGSTCGAHALRDVSIPMRDGKSLAAFVRAPIDPGCELPVILIQTPYGKENARQLWFDSGTEPLFSSTDYAFAVVDWRGFFGSTGAAVSGAQPYGDDGFDTVEWLAAQPWSNGRVGTWGVSALCQQQYRTAVKKPPHLAAMVPIFCDSSFRYEQYYPGGVLRREYFEFISAYFGGGIVLQHPTYDAAWQVAERLTSPADVTVPVLVVAGWFDLYPIGSVETFTGLRSGGPPAVRELHRLLIGPWIHFAAGGETSGSGRALDAEELTYFDSERRIQRDSLAWFDQHLRGVPSAATAWPPVRFARAGEGTWDSADHWPSSGTSTRTLYLAADGSLADTPPASGSVSFAYDPSDPSPTIGGATLLPRYHHGPTDQAPVLARADTRSFVSAPLSASLRIEGPIELVLDVSTTGRDTDFAVRVTDVDSTGKHLLIAEGIRRLKLRGDLATVLEVTPGARYRVPIRTTSDLAYTFAPGHRLGVIVSSSNYARFDRNPNTGADFVPDGGTTMPVDNTVYTDGASALVVRVR